MVIHTYASSAVSQHFNAETNRHLAKHEHAVERENLASIKFGELAFSRYLVNFKFGDLNS